MKTPARYAWVVGGALLLACASGFYESFSTAWGALYRLNVQAHPTIGLAALALFVLVASVATTRYKTPAGGRPWMFVLVMLVPLAAAAGTGLLMRADAWSSIAVRVSAVHAAMGWLVYAALGVGTWFMARSGGRRKLRTGTLLIFSAWLAVPGLAIVADRVGRPEEYRFHLSPLIADYPGTQYPTASKRVVEALSATDGCGATGGCHADLLHDHARSAHDRSTHTAYFQKSVALLEHEEGLEATRICGGCHYPVGLLEGAHYNEFTQGHAYSCAFCHSISETWYDASPRSGLVLAPNVDHLELFQADGDGDVSAEARSLIRANPRGHARVFSRPLYKTDDYCMTCHHLMIKQPMTSDAFVRPSCRDCHMQARRFVGRTGEKRNHLFLGSNTSLPFALGDSEMVDLIQHWLKGNLILRGLDAFWELRESARQEPTRAFWLIMSFDPQEAPVAGKSFVVKLLTSNVGIGHEFPSAPLDLVEAWPSLTAEDGRGRVFFRSGDLDRGGHLADDGHRLGGYMLDAEGRKIDRNRVWVTAKKVVERVIPPGQTIEDVYTVPIPDTVSGEIELKATWNHRKLNQEFVDWVYEGKAVRMPVSEVARIEQRFRIEGTDVE